MPDKAALSSLPHDEEAEKGLLGALLSNGGNYLDEVSVIVSPDDFYSTSNREIFRGLIELKDNQETIDLLHLTRLLDKSKGRMEASGGVSYISMLTDSYSLSTHVVDYAKMIKEKAMRREALKIAKRVEEDATDNSKEIIGILDAASKDLTDVYVGLSGEDEDKNISQYVSDLFNKINRVLKNEEVPEERLATGFDDLDSKCSGGFVGGDYVIIAARPSIGKTAFSVSMALNMIRRGHKVAFFSLEMPAESIAKRVLSIESKIYAKSIARMSIKDQDMEGLFEATARLYQTGKDLYIIDKANMPLMALRAKARQLYRKHKIECIIIDYIGIISLYGEVGIRPDAPRFEQIAYISKSLKGLARELNIPVIALCQVNRDSEDKEPMLSNLRDSGAIEQDADVVCFLHRKRDSVKGEEESVPSADGSENYIPVKLIIAKNRDGEVGVATIGFFNKTTAFVNMAPTMYQSQ